MVIYIKEWCENLIIAVIISIIIEMILPDGNNRKYVKIITGIYIMFLILNPIVELLKKDVNIPSFSNYKLKETSAEFDNSIKDIYILGIEESIKNELLKLGILARKVELKTDSNYSTIEKVILFVEEKIQNYNDLYDYFYNNFSLDSNNIEIRGITND